MNNNFWHNYYKKNPKQEHSLFAKFVLPYLGGMVFELGAGNGADLEFFIANGIPAFGIDAAFEGGVVVKQDLIDTTKRFKSPDYVYTRFLWHSISHKEQEAILKWCKGFLFIEARTLEDSRLPKTFKNHRRNFVDVTLLIKELRESGFQILYLCEGTGLSPFKDEDPYLCRVIAKKKSP